MHSRVTNISLNQRFWLPQSLKLHYLTKNLNYKKNNNNQVNGAI